MIEPEQDKPGPAERNTPDPGEIARQIAANPNLRAKFFRNPQAAVAKAVPGKLLFGLHIDAETRARRNQAIAKVLDAMEAEGEVASSIHADAVMEQFFREAMRNPHMSFLAILGFSTLTLAAGVALIVAGIVTAFVFDDTRHTVISSMFGGTGVATALGSVYALARRGVSLANANHAQLRLILAGFATELGHLRAYHLQGLLEIKEVNEKIREAMEAAVGLIQTRVKVEPVRGEPHLAGPVGAPWPD